MKIEFDKNRILSCATADRAIIGEVGWFANNVHGMKTEVNGNLPMKKLEGVGYNELYCFRDSTNANYALFYPAKTSNFWEQMAYAQKEMYSIAEYCVVAELDPSSQSVKVNKMLGEGWELFGTTDSFATEGTCVFAQAMIRRRGTT